jgi:hypothetical protein
MLADPNSLEGKPQRVPSQVTDETFEQPVMLDHFGYPVLYYAANTRFAKRPNAAVAGYGDDPNAPKGIFTFSDNALFTGMKTTGNTGPYDPWDFGAGKHKIQHFGVYNTPDGLPDAQTIDADVNTFPYYILNKELYKSTNKRSAIPHRRDSFLLITPGPDGLYGTPDDVTNF